MAFTWTSRASGSAIMLNDLITIKTNIESVSGKLKCSSHKLNDSDDSYCYNHNADWVDNSYCTNHGSNYNHCDEDG